MFCIFLYRLKAGGQGRLPNSVVAQDGRLQFTSISEGDAGTYVCRARNNAGNSEARAEVIVNGKIFLIYYGSSNPFINIFKKYLQRNKLYFYFCYDPNFQKIKLL